MFNHLPFRLIACHSRNMAKVDNAHTFAFGACLPDATNFFLGAQVAYTYTTAGD